MLEGLQGVEGLGFELTDVTEVGMASVAKVPRLRRLKVYAGRGFTDRELARLKGMNSLESLELTNTRVTNDGLVLLCELPNLRSLKIFCEPRLGVLDERGLVHRKALTKLETLQLTGGWVSHDAAANLQMQMPHCKVTGDPVKTISVDRSR